MTEISKFWDGTTVGDATQAPYDAPTEFARAMMSIAAAFSVPTNFGGVFRDELNELAVSGAVTPVTVETGRALVFGAWYENDVALTVAIPTPGGATRIDRIVLRKDWVAQTVRVTRIAGAEGGAAPALVQVAGTTWDVPLAQVSITTGGVITVTSDREFIPYHGDQSGEGGTAHTYAQIAGQPTDQVGNYDAATPTSNQWFDTFRNLVALIDFYSISGAGNVTVTTDATTGKPYIRINGADSASHYVVLSVGGAGGVVMYRAAENHHFKCMVNEIQAPVDATQRAAIGFMEVLGDAIGDGIFFRSIDSGNWFLVCRNAGVETAVDLGIALSATKVMLEFRISGGSTVQAYVNGVLTGAAISTNVPANVLYLSACVQITAAVTTEQQIGIYGWGTKGGW